MFFKNFLFQKKNRPLRILYPIHIFSVMEDPNKAALEKIRLAIPRYRPGSGKDNNNHFETPTADSISTSSASSSSSVVKQTFTAAFASNNSNNSGRTANMHSASVGTTDDMDGDDGA